MMMITRTESSIEFGLGETKRLSIDVSCINGAMLAAERMPCGRIGHALVLNVAGCADPVRIDGGAIELTEVHSYVVETMLQLGAAIPRQ
jgi:hypothetical protein